MRIGVIGGTGLYQLSLPIVEQIYTETPFGFPSGPVQVCSLNGHLVYFLSRHSQGHASLPLVNVKANIAILKHLGVDLILSFSAVGSLREDIHPLDFVIPTQLIDRCTSITLYDDIVCHCSPADPFPLDIGAVLHSTLQELGIRSHFDKTLVCIQGPCFSTRAESNLYRQWGCDIVNMSGQEAKLAREAEIVYALVCMSTDYDCWLID